MIYFFYIMAKDSTAGVAAAGGSLIRWENESEEL